MKKIIVSIVCLLLVGLFFIGFIDKDISTNDVDDTSIVYTVNNIPNDLQKVTCLSKSDENLICATSRGLVKKDSEGGICPELVKDMEVSEDGIEYRFKLRDDIYWSDGNKIKSKDIVNFFKELLQYEDEKNITSLLNVYGARDYRNGKVNFEDGVAIICNEDLITIRLNSKDDNFIDELTKPQYRLRQRIKLWSNICDTYNELIFSGDYKIEFVDKESIKLSKNKKNKNELPGNISIIKDENEEMAMAAFEIGSRDIVENPPRSQLDRLYSENKLITMPSNESLFIALNSDKSKLTALDRREIYRIIYDAIEEYEGQNSKEIEVAEGSYFRKDKDNLAKLQARKVSMNKEEKWNKLDAISLLAVDNNDNRDICKFLKTWFRDKENIDLRYSLVNVEEFNSLEQQNRYSITLLNLKTEGDSRKELFTNIKCFFTEEENKIFERELVDGNDSFSELEEQLYSSYRLLPISFKNNNIAISEKISNLKLDGNGNIDFDSINS